MNRWFPPILAAVLASALTGSVTYLLVTPSPNSAPQSLTHGPSLPSAADAIAHASAAVVNVYSIPQASNSRSRLGFFGRHAQPRSTLGSGVVIHRDGYILTNAHLIGRRTEVHVELHDLTQHPASVQAYDEETDLAVLKIETSEPLVEIEVGDPHDLRVGDRVFAIGNPRGVGQSVTAGIVSAGIKDTGSPYVQHIQTDAAVNPGNSGGALINALGQLVAINTFIVSQSGGSEGIGFAIPIDIALSIVQELLTAGYVKRGWVGVVDLRPISALNAARLGLPEAECVYVRARENGGPLADAGIRPGDVIIAVDNKQATWRQLSQTVLRARPGERIQMQILRGKEMIDVEIVATERPHTVS